MSEIDWYRMTERPEGCAEEAKPRRGAASEAKRPKGPQGAARELRRKLRRQAIMEWIGLAVLTPLSVLLFWLLLAATPDQSSAINDLDAAAEAARSDTGEGANREAARSDTEAMP